MGDIIKIVHPVCEYCLIYQSDFNPATMKLYEEPADEPPAPPEPPARKSAKPKEPPSDAVEA
jgi:hypothetical protein